MGNVVVIAFLIGLVIFGLMASMDVKTFRDYSVGKGEFSDLALIATIVGTWVGASVFVGGAEYAYLEGWAEIIGTMGLIISFWLNGWYVIPKLSKYMHTFSITHALGNMYGPTIQVMGAVAMLIFDICKLIIEFIILQKVLAIFFNINESVALVIVVAFTTLYALKGGIVAVVITDVIQFIVFLIGLPMIIYCLWDGEVYGQLLNIDKFHNLNIREYFDFTGDEFNPSRFTKLISLTILCAFPCMDSGRFQRLLASRDPKRAKWIFLYAGLIIAVINIVMYIISLMVLVKDPSVAEEDIVYNFINALYNSGFGALILLVILSMSMSTIDSIINVTSVIAVFDILRLCNPDRGVRLVNVTKLCGVLISMIATCATIIGIDKSLLELLYFGYQAYLAVVLVPLLLYVYDYRFDPLGAKLGIIASLVMIVIFQHIEINEVYGFLAVLAATPIFMYTGDYFVVSYGEDD